MAGRRGNGSATIERHRDRYRVRVTMPDGRRVPMRSVATEGEAVAMRDAIAEAMASGEYVEASGLTLAQMGASWLNRREIEGSQQRREIHGIGEERSAWNRHVAPSALGSMPIDAITIADVAAFVKELQKKTAMRVVTFGRGANKRVEERPTKRPLSDQVIKHALRLVRQCMEHAVVKGWIPSNPARAVTVTVRPAEYAYLTAAEVEQLLTCEDVPEPKRLLFGVAIFTGMRAGELWGLRWEDIELDRDRPRLSVRRSYDHGTTKGGKIRRAPLLPRAVDLLLEWRELSGRTTGLVFPAPDGSMHAKGYDAGWARNLGKLNKGYRWKAGIRRTVTFHELRDTCASHLLMGSWGRRWTLDEVRDFLGHQDPRETARYAHLAPDVMDDAAAETAGANRPPIVPRPSAKSSRTLWNSNPRPSAPEAVAAANDDAGLGVPAVPRGTVARKVLALAGNGEPIPADVADALAQGILAERRYRLAAAVLAGGPHVARHVLELASLVIADDVVCTGATDGAHKHRNGTNDGRT
jgi:integrase